MTWQDELTIMVRAILNDLVTPQKYSDEYIQRVIVTAGVIVTQDLMMPPTYSFNVGDLIISPDPIANGDRALHALLPLKAACILNVGDFQKALGQGIRVRDGDSAIDTSVSFRGFRDILEFGPCAAYEALKKDILLKSDRFGAGSVGAAVISPFRSPGDNPVSDIQTFYDNFAYSMYYDHRRDR